MPTQPPRRGGPRKKLIAAVVLGTLALICLLTAMVYWLSGPRVPDVVGQTAREAKQSVGDDYKIDVSGERVAGLPKGTIIVQNPDPEEPAERVSTISVIVSAGQLPDVVGQTESEAERSTGDDYKIDVDEVRVDSKPKGTIIEQNPGPGESAELGMPISVIVSAGEPKNPGDVFEDDFSNTSSGWPRGEAYKNTSSYFVADYFHGSYRIFNAPSDPPLGSTAAALNSSVGNQQDMIVEVDAQVSGDAPKGEFDLWGLICRAQDYENYYMMSIDPFGTSGIWKLEDGKWQRLTDGKTKYAVRGGTKKNHLRADCVGNKLSLFVNGRKLVEAEDSTFESGIGGLYVGDTGDEKLEVLFDNFMVSDTNMSERYATSDFEPPLSLILGGSDGWYIAAPETTDEVSIYGPESGGLVFTNPRHVFAPTNSSELKGVPAPENTEEWVSWLQSHPNLNTSKPHPVRVGGISGKLIDVTASSMPENYPREFCGEQPCVPLYPLSDEHGIVGYEGYKDRFVIVDVGGEMVLIDAAAPTDKFDEFLPKAQKVLDSVKWIGR